MSKKFNLYLGKAGHLAVMSEYLVLGWNVAIPEVDVGDDIFVVKDDNGTLRRLQVKTVTANGRQDSYSAQFNISVKNLRNITDILVHYIFIVRHNDAWSKPVVIRQDYLLDHVENEKIGSLTKGNITFYISFANQNVSCSGKDFTKYIRDFTDFPKIEH